MRTFWNWVRTLFFGAVLVVVALMIVLGIYGQAKMTEECERAGGTYTMDRLGHSICLAPSTVIPLR